MKTTLPILLPLLLSLAAPLAADFIVKDPKACPEADSSASIVLSEAPLGVRIDGAADCKGYDATGGMVRVWKFAHQYQRLAAAKAWKLTVEKGDGDRNTYVLPASSVVGVFLHRQTEGKWKGYRGASKNPIALTQPAIVLTLEKQTQRGAAGLKQQFLIWDVLTIDPLNDADGGYQIPAGTELRAESVWIWQGLNPLPKKLALGTGKAKLTLQAE